MEPPLNGLYSDMGEEEMAGLLGAEKVGGVYVERPLNALCADVGGEKRSD